MDGERVIVPWWLYQYSFWHGASVFLSVLGLVVITACLVCEHAWKALRSRRAPAAGTAAPERAWRPPFGNHRG
jgi:hypothetical protein